ncbi:ATP-dependent helicase [Candidatus Woesearchaeota archaeon]|nr:ATP-dependent helicase [Candidatus Woesearchaeota archaeon]
MTDLKIPEEKRVILDDDLNNIKVIAGPGSGKTTLIVEKIKRLVKKGVLPEKILVITYTNKAADDLARKIFEELPDKKGFYVSTIHSFCTKFMRENNTYFPEFRDFRVLDELGQFLFIVKFNNSIRSEELPLMRNSILSLKNYFGRIKDNYALSDLKDKENAILKSYLNYCQLLKDNKKFDFGDLIHTVIDKINESPDLKKIAINKFGYLFIDEYQDINNSQERLIELFYTPNNKIMVVGDVNQSIYGFRGSDITIIMNFEKTFSKFHPVKTYFLKTNFRSTQKIIDLSNSFFKLTKEKCIDGNYDARVDKITKPGTITKLNIYDNESDEAESIVKYLLTLRKDNKNINLSDVAILFKSVKKDAKLIIQELKKNGLDYEVIGDGGLFEVDYVTAILNCFGQLIRGEDISDDLLKICVAKESKNCEKLKECTPIKILYFIFENSKFIKESIEKNKEGILFNLGALTRIFDQNIQTFGNSDLEVFVKGLNSLDESFLDTNQPTQKENNSIKILTLHKSKGLEFPVVIIPSITKKKYYAKNGDLIHDLFKNYIPEDDLKRAFYVGITRAKQALFLSYYEEPSEFILDLRKNDGLLSVEESHHGSGLNKFFKEEVKENLVIEPTQIKKEVLNLTYYKLIEFWKCNFAYKLRFHNNFILPYTGELSYGSDIHNLLWQINTIIKDKHTLDIEEISGLLDEKYRDGFKKHRKRIEKYLKNLNKELKNIVTPELPFDFIKYGALIKGRVDLLVKNSDGGYTIIEFKSGHYHDAKSGNKRDDFLKAAIAQIEVYALALKCNVTKGIVYFFGDGYKKEILINKKEMDLKLFETIAKIRNQEFNPTDKKEVCKGCVLAINNICPFNKNKSKNIVLDEDCELDNEKDRINQLF